MSTNGDAPFAAASAVAGVAREVEALRRSVEPLAGLPARVDELARVVTHLAEEVAAKTRPREVVHAPSWLDASSSVETAAGVLRDLVAWLEEVYLRYPDGAKTLPDCWMWHPDVVEELLWLMHAWCAAYRDDEAPVTMAGDWHDRYRPGVVRRIKAAAGACSLENHQHAGAHSGTRPVVPLGEALGSIADWWATHRSDEPPAPTQAQVEAAEALSRTRNRR